MFVEYLLIYILCIVSVAIAQNETIDPSSRINCYPEPGMSMDQAGEQKCLARGCIYDSVFDYNHPTTPHCYFPANTGYIVESIGTNSVNLKKAPQSVVNPYGVDFTELVFGWEEIGSGIHLWITPKNSTRYRPPIDITTNPNILSQDKLSVVVQNNSIFSFLVQRQSSKTNIWDTSIGGLLFADKYLQISTKLPTDQIYGFGYNVHHSIKHNLSNYTTWGFFARSEAVDSTSYDNGHNYYGVHIFYLGLEPDGSAYGVFFFNSNAQEITTGPAPHLTYRTIGGQLEYFFFPGPTPEDVIQQYQQVIGRPYLPSYWALGFQLSRYGYGNLSTLEAAINRTTQAGIPFDGVICGIECMYLYRDFTIDSTNFGGMPNYTDWVHANNMHLTLAFDPALDVNYISFQRAIQQNVSFIEWPTFDLVPTFINNKYPLTNGTKLMLGNVWPEDNVAFPDFLDPSNVTDLWWANEYAMFHNTIQFDGIWIDMNEPSNFYTGVYNETHGRGNSTWLLCPVVGPHSEWDIPPFQTINVYGWESKYNNSHLCSQTLCMLGVSIRGTERFYNTKNLYSVAMVKATSLAQRTAVGKRGNVISRSTYPSSGRYGGTWLGDTKSTWWDIKTSNIGVQEFNMFGLPFIGSDICGFSGDTTEELCLRWQQVGAFYPYMRNHNNKGSRIQDPGLWPTVAAATKKANLFRYRHLPYLFSLHFSVSLRGGTVLRPVFFEFPKDNFTHDLSFQFMWGAALLVAPILNENVTSVTAYIPEGEIWYSVYDYFYGSTINTGYQSFPAPWDYFIPVFVRGGYILPRQRPSTNTVASRENEFQILVALDAKGLANGELFWDDGDSLIPNDDFTQHDYYHFLYTFVVTQQEASLNISTEQAATNLTLKTLDNLEIFGYPYQPNLNTATLNGVPVAINQQTSSYSPFTQVLNITTTGLINLNTNGPKWVLSWKNM